MSSLVDEVFECRFDTLGSRPSRDFRDPIQAIIEETVEESLSDHRQSPDPVHETVARKPGTEQQAVRERANGHSDSSGSSKAKARVVRQSRSPVKLRTAERQNQKVRFSKLDRKLLLFDQKPTVGKPAGDGLNDKLTVSRNQSLADVAFTAMASESSEAKAAKPSSRLLEHSDTKTSSIRVARRTFHQNEPMKVVCGKVRKLCDKAGPKALAERSTQRVDLRGGRPREPGLLLALHQPKRTMSHLKDDTERPRVLEVSCEPIRRLEKNIR